MRVEVENVARRTDKAQYARRNKFIFLETIYKPISRPFGLSRPFEGRIEDIPTTTAP